jgi:hypothetical protein
MTPRLVLLSGLAVLVVSASARAQEEGPPPDYMMIPPTEEQVPIEPPPMPPEVPPDTGAMDPNTPLPNIQVIDRVNQDVDQEIKRLDKVEGGVPSLLFTEGEYASLMAAIASYRSGNYLSPGDVDPAFDVPMISNRHLVLAGISYGNGQNWVIWLNGTRMTPESLSPEVRDIKVYKNYVEVRWFDDVTQAVIPVRLRPNQRFNLDTQSFNPG